MDAVLVQINELTKVFDKQTAIRHLNLKIPEGKMVALAGPDGAGKTTLMRLMAGILLPTEGSITIAGHDTRKDSQIIHEFIGYMPQKFGLYEDLTVIQNLNLYADLKGLIGQPKQEVFDKLLSFTQLSSFIHRLAGNLSGGMKQKLGLACSLLAKPRLLLLDEPTVGVDPISRRELWKMLSELLQEGITVIWSTAYLDEAEQCDHVILLREGTIIYEGAAKDLTTRVQGRTFKIKGITGSRRKVLSYMLNQTEVLDGVIQGSEVRIVTKENQTTLDLEHLEEEKNLECSATEPRFEDGFIDILGGGPGGKSLLAEKFTCLSKESDSCIEVHELCKRFGNFTAVDHINFSVKRGEVFGLLGPNGAGKSTTFRMLCGLLEPTSGYTRINGVDLQKASGASRSHIGYMAQKFSLYGGLSVLQNLKVFSGLYNLYGAKQKGRIEEMIEIFDFKDYLSTSAQGLPLGYKQRLALACSLMHHPEVLFLDEPTSGVDPLMRREFWNHINGLVEKGTTIMLTTHFMDEAENCDRIGLIYEGRFITIGTPDHLKEMTASKENPSPTLEDAFITLIKDKAGVK
jgi:ABC-2 type transport system ATP-binding protein